MDLYSLFCFRPNLVSSVRLYLKKEKSIEVNKQFSDMPTTPMPSVKVSQNSRRRWLMIGTVVGVLIALCVGILLVRAMNTGKPSLSQAGSTAAQATGTAIEVQSTLHPVSTSTSTGGPAYGSPASPTPNLAQPGVTHGKPHIGGPFSDFRGEYGTPTSQGDSTNEEFWVDPQQTIDITVAQNDQGEVTQLTVLGPDTWNEQQAQSYCTQFLPDGATQFQTTSNQIDYHSSVGTIVLSLQSTSCSLSLARH